MSPILRDPTTVGPRGVPKMSFAAGGRTLVLQRRSLPLRLLLTIVLLLQPVSSQQACGRPSDGKIYLGGLFDTTTDQDTKINFDLAIAMLKNHTDGWHDDLLTDAALNTTVEDGACDGATAGPLYFKLKNQWASPLHGIVGTRCSGASMAVARIAGLEKINQISFSATSAKLSDPAEFPYFTRTVAPDDGNGQVGAIVALLRHFGWTHVSVLYTDTAYTRGLHTEFSKAWTGDHGEWEGEITEEHAVTWKSVVDRTLDFDNLKNIMGAVFGDRPLGRRTKVVVLMAHNQHAFPILKFAHQEGFQDDDTIWIATDGWAGKPPTAAHGGDSWMPTFPGYLGVVPYRNKASEYHDYLSRLNEHERSKGLAVTNKLPVYVAETVDAIVAFAKALTGINHTQRSDGELVRTRIRALTWKVSERVSLYSCI